MASITKTVEIAAPPERVWSVLVDLDRLDEWVGAHRGFPDGAPPQLRAGVTYTQKVALAGQEADMEWTVSEFDEPRRLGFTGAGPAGSEAAMSYVLAEADGGDTTRVEYETSYELPGGPLGAVAGKVLEPRSGDEADDTLGNLKRVVESR